MISDQEILEGLKTLNSHIRQEFQDVLNKLQSLSKEASDTEKSVCNLQKDYRHDIAQIKQVGNSLQTIGGAEQFAALIARLHDIYNLLEQYPNLRQENQEVLDNYATAKNSLMEVYVQVEELKLVGAELSEMRQFLESIGGLTELYDSILKITNLINQFKSEWSQLELVNKFRQEIENLLPTLQAQTLEHQQLQQQVTSIEQSLGEYQNTLQTYHGYLQKLNEQFNRGQQQIVALEAAKTSEHQILQQQLTELRTSIDYQNSVLTNNNRQITDLNDLANNLEQQVKQLVQQQSLDNQKRQQEITALDSKITTVQRELVQTQQSENQKRQQEITALDSRISRLQRELVQTQQSENQKRQQEITALDSRISRLQRELVQTQQSENQKRQQEITALDSQVNSIQKWRCPKTIKGYIIFVGMAGIIGGAVGAGLTMYVEQSWVLPANQRQIEQPNQ